MGVERILVKIDPEIIAFEEMLFGVGALEKAS